MDNVLIVIAIANALTSPKEEEEEEEEEEKKKEKKDVLTTIKFFKIFHRIRTKHGIYHHGT